MCAYKTLCNTKDGYVIQCNGCDHIQVAFGTTCQTFTQDQFYEHIRTVDECYNIHNLNAFKDQKCITIPTVARSMSLVYSVNELKKLLQLLINGRNSLEHEKLFVFNEN